MRIEIVYGGVIKITAFDDVIIKDEFLLLKWWKMAEIQITLKITKTITLRFDQTCF